MMSTLVNTFVQLLELAEEAVDQCEAAIAAEFDLNLHKAQESTWLCGTNQTEESRPETESGSQCHRALHQETSKQQD